MFIFIIIIGKFGGLEFFLSLFLFFFFLSLDLFLLALCRSSVLFLHLSTLSDTNILLDSSGRGIGPTQRYFPGNTDILDPSRIRKHNTRNQVALHPCLRPRDYRDFSCFLQRKIEYLTLHEYILLALFLQIITISNKGI